MDPAIFPGLNRPSGPASHVGASFDLPGEATRGSLPSNDGSLYWQRSSSFIVLNCGANRDALMSMVGFYATTDPAADALLSTRSNPNNVAVNERGLRKYLVINSEVDQLIQEAKHHASIPHHQQHRNNSLILLNGFLALADYRSITLEATKQGDPLTDNTSIDLDQVWLSFNPELLARPYVPTWDQADMDWNVSG